MNIITAKNAGFCFGVKRAVETVYDTIEASSNAKIYTLGNIAHNPIISSDFRSRGVEVIGPEDIERIYEETNSEVKSVIIVRTHGIPKSLNDRLISYSAAKGNFKVIDCTCPCVKKIHRIVSDETDSKSLLIVIGDPNHPEVDAIKSYSNGKYCIYSSADEINEPETPSERVICVSQTTQKLSEWKKCQKKIKNLYTNPFIFDTICSVTENRQNEVASLAKEVDAMLIIGGRESSNTNKLYEIAKQYCSSVYFIENSSEIPEDLILNHFNVGIAAGASTPSSIIEEVKKTMIDNEKATVIENGENFAEMLESSLKTLNTGETVTGIITYVSPSEIHVDLSAKVTGIIPSSELSDSDAASIEQNYKVGDEIQAIVCRVSDLDGVATLSKKRIDSINSWKTIVNAAETHETLEGKVTEVVKGGMVMNIGGTKVFVPATLSGQPKDTDLNTLLRTVQKVKIIDVNEQRRRAVASIKSAKNEERKALADAFWAQIEKEKKYTGTVKSLTSYGAFVDLGGVDGMVHSSELSWRRIKHPSEIVSIGDVIEVYVKDFDPETKRISLGYKTEDNDPWNIFNAKYKVGDVASVKIVSMMPFGAFAEVVPGADGLIHISQIADKKIARPADVLEIGQVVDAKIVDINPETRKISLSMRALLEEAAPAEETAEEAPAEETAKEAPAEE